MVEKSLKTMSQKMLCNARVDIFKILNESKTIWYSRFFEYPARVYFHWIAIYTFSQLYRPKIWPDYKKKDRKCKK